MLNARILGDVSWKRVPEWSFGWMAPAMLLALMSITSRSEAGDRLFSVQDSIELSNFVDPETRIGDKSDDNVHWSPDRKHFAVVTARGVIQSNEIESTLWIFDSDQVRKVLLAPGPGKPVEPRMLARLAAITNDRTVISDVQWSPDSRGVFFIGHSAARGRQLYRANILTGKVETVSPPGKQVSQYALGAQGTGHLVFAVSIPNVELQKALQGHPIGSGARDVTGMPLDAMLFPSKWLDDEIRRTHELWESRSGRSTPVIDRNSGRPVKIINCDDGYGNILSPSPDGRYTVVLQPADHWNSEWNGYEPGDPNRKFSPGEQGSEYFAYWAEWPAEYSLVDLATGKTTSLVNAPIARFEGYGQPTRAVWSPDGKKILLGATYLPLGVVDPEERSRRARPCAAAVVDVPSGRATCVRPMGRASDPNALFVGDISFGSSSQEVIVHVVNIGRKEEPVERYQEDKGIWRLVVATELGGPNDHGATDTALPAEAAKTISVVVYQGLNQPPAVYAKDPASGIGRVVWDPNPQISRLTLGQASVLQWKDARGHQWVAGLVKPPGFVPGVRYPLVIQTHAFVENHFLTDGGYTTALAARPLASSGMVVLQMPYNPEHFVTGQELDDQILGFESAIELLNSDGLIDPSRVGIIGFSRTCYHVLGMLIKNPNRFAAATVADGMDESYLEYLTYSVGRGGRQPEQEAIYGGKPFGDALKVWIQSAPGFNMYRIKTPLRIEADSGVASLLYQWESYSSLVLQGRPVDLILFPDGVHQLQKPSERLASQQGNVDWFRFWLQSYEDPDPSKREQYRRWRQLRKLQEGARVNELETSGRGIQ